MLKSSDDGASMLSGAVFYATALCPLVDVGGEAGFDYQRFNLLCAEHTGAET